MEDRYPDSPIRKARDRCGLLLVEAAARADVSPGYLSMIENGYRPARKIRERVAAALGATTAELWPELDS